MKSDVRSALVAKFKRLVSDLPDGFDVLASIKVEELAAEVARLPLKERLLVARFSSLMTQIEALKMLSSELYRARAEEVAALREGLFYQDLLPLIVFFEFWKDLDVGKARNLSIMSDLLREERFNKIRNAIAHADFEFRGQTLILNDRGHTREYDFMKVTKLASCLATLVALMVS